MHFSSLNRNGLIYLFMLISLKIKPCSAQDPKLIGLWPFNIQYGVVEVTGSQRHGSVHGEITTQAQAHYFLWPEQSDSYITVPAVTTAIPTDGYVHIYLHLYLDSTATFDQQILYMGDVDCSLEIFYTSGKLKLRRGIAGVYDTVSKTYPLNTLQKLVFTYTECNRKMILMTTYFPCLVIFDTESSLYELKEVTEASNCPNLYSHIELGRGQGSRLPMHGSIYCFALYTGRTEVGEYVPEEHYQYLDEQYCSGEN